MDMFNRLAYNENTQETQDPARKVGVFTFL